MLTRTARVLAVAVMVASTLGTGQPAFAAPQSVPALPEIGTFGPRAHLHPKLDSRLARVSKLERERGGATARAEAVAAGLITTAVGVRVVVESRDAALVRSLILAAGGSLEAESGGLIQASVPAASLELLADAPSVSLVRPPYPHQALSVGGQGVGATGADLWQSAGYNGAGVKVAIVDLGFAGYPARQAAGDLPASLTAVDMCSGQLLTATVHGAAVAEIVYEMAPGAQLYLICIDTEVQLANAVAYAKTNGITIVNHSVSWFNSARGDGSGGAGTPNAIVADARANGILWVNAAGNYAQRHWSGTFVDANVNGFHDFAAGDEGESVNLSAGVSFCAFLKWDSWPTSAQDYDLVLARSAGGVVVASSENVQTGTQPPTEELCYTSATSETYALFIYKFSATQTPRFDLFLTSGSVPQYVVSAGSVTEPGSSPAVLTAGAICWQGSALESYSSLGPTIDGRIKPDIAGQDAVSSGTYGLFTACGASGFTGTSAAAPHVAGAAALLKQATAAFGYGPAQLQALLESRSVDLGAAGKDNSFGSGRLALGAVPAAGGRGFGAYSRPRPASSKFLVADSEPGDPLLNGQMRVLTNANSTFTAFSDATARNFVQLLVQTSTGNWVLNISAPSGQQFAVGNVEATKRSDAPTLDLSADGFACNSTTGRYQIHEVNYSATALETFDVTFELHCNDGAAALRGEVRFAATPPVTASSTVLTWSPGFKQAGYLVLRVGGAGTEVLLSGAGLIPAATTTYTDVGAPAGFVCYAVAAVAANVTVLGLSDLGCVISGIATGMAPRNFIARMNQSSTATISWIPPGGQSNYILAPLSGAAPVTLSGTATSFTVVLAGAAECYLLFALAAASVIGYSDVVCAVSGFSTLGASIQPSVTTAIANLRQRQSSADGWERMGDMPAR